MNLPPNLVTEPDLALGTEDLQAIAARLRNGQGPKYWRSLDELARTEEFVAFLHREFPEQASEWTNDVSRRHFLKLMGASLALAGLTACTRQPLEKIVPYVKQPEELVPGRPLYFATAMTLGGYATGLVVESHEGHPTKIEGNPAHPMSRGSTTVFHQASLLDLYDPDRSQAVLNHGNIDSWERFLAALNAALAVQQTKHGAGLRLLTGNVTSPTLAAQISAVLQRFPEARWHQYEPLALDNVREGARLAFGEIVSPQYRFDQARTILALDSDFLFSHPAALRHTRDFTDGRRITAGGEDMNRLYSVESTVSITGTNADHRLPLRFHDIENFARAIAQGVGAISEQPAGALMVNHGKWIAAVLDDLKASRGSGVVIAGESQPPIVHALAHHINKALGNVGSTVIYTEPAEARPVNQLADITALGRDLAKGSVELLLIAGGNPVFNAPADLHFAEALSRAQLRVHLSPDVNETSIACHWHVPQNHYLESWSDARAYDGTMSIVQPLILPLYAGKSVHEFIDAIIAPSPRTDYDIVRDYWESRKIWPDFENGWRKALNDGLVADTALPAKSVPAANLQLPAQVRAGALEIVFRADPGIWDGSFANNGWLQELPKPMTKLTWDNAALISPATAQRLQLANGDVVEIQTRGHKLELPVWVTPGLPADSLTLHVGNGRQVVGRVGSEAGFNVYRLRDTVSFSSTSDVRIIKTGKSHLLATTQTHHNIDSEERQIYRETTLAGLLGHPRLIQEKSESPAKGDTLLKPNEHDYAGYRWGMSIDLTTCVGCNACIIACQAENNIPVVGKAEVARHREMHWIRLDHYFSGHPDNPEISSQPVPCMHCENAPCELVCPVAATMHDHEGLNVQVYNRCVGTRYCSNNCPYKVRRFNFFQYADLKTPSYVPMRNPNVTVRWRGVMEKCTYCIQRISATRIQSELEGRRIRDGEIRTACQQACPANAIIFGDLSDPDSHVTALKRHPLDFGMLAQQNTRPRTSYIAKVRNPNPALATEPNGGGHA